MVRSEGNKSLKNPVTPPGIDPGTVGIVAQCLNHYATPGPFNFVVCINLVTDQFWNGELQHDAETQVEVSPLVGALLPMMIFTVTARILRSHLSLSPKCQHFKQWSSNTDFKRLYLCFIFTWKRGLPLQRDCLV